MLVSDDATSAVDSRGESVILDALKRATPGRTSVITAHRRSALRLADRIAVLDRGRLVDVGTYEELGQRCAIFRRPRRSDCLVLDRGSIVEDGHHDELLAADGHHARLWHAHTP